MNNYCIHLKRRKNKPFCKLKNEEIPFSCCQECSNKEYKKAQSLKKIATKKSKMHNKSKKLTKLERNRYSVFSDNIESCYLCGSTHNLTWHEVYAGRNRQNSMKFGFCLRLCLNCHSEEQENSQFNAYWYKQGQLYWEEKIGSREEFIKTFKRNYLD